MAQNHGCIGDACSMPRHIAPPPQKMKVSLTNEGRRYLNTAVIAPVYNGVIAKIFESGKLDS